MTRQSVTCTSLVVVCSHGLATAQVVLPVIATGSDGAYVDCPCANNSSAGPQIYGMGSCKPWDADGASRPFADECKQQQPAAWCTSLWCYVDPNDCSRANHPSVLGQIAFFSYTTCGNIDPWALSQHVAVNTVLPQKVSVGVPEVGYYVSRTNPKNFSAMRVALKFAHYAFQDMGMLQNIVYRNFSDFSLQISRSTYTTCVHDVAIGNLDACLGDLWQTPERLGFGVAFLEVYPEDVYLLTLSAKQEEFSLWDTLKKPFSPFSWDLWALIIGTYIAAAALFAVLEHREHEMFEDHQLHESFVRSVYEVSMSFLGGGLTYEANSLGGRVLLFGIGFFIMISVASFTASTATSLIVNAEPKPAIRDLHDALSKGQRICYGFAAANALQRKFPALQMYGVVTSKEIEYMLAGKCGSLILSEPRIRDLQAAGKLCGYTMVGKPVMSFSVGFYVSDSLRARLAVATTRLKLDGTWNELERELLKETACSTVSEEKDDGFSELTSEHMLGTCLLLLICAAVAVAVKCIKPGISSLCRTNRSLPVARTDEEDMPNSDLQKDALEPTQMTLQNAQISPMEPNEPNRNSTSTCLDPGPMVNDDHGIIQKLRAMLLDDLVIIQKVDLMELTTSKAVQDERREAPSRETTENTKHWV